MSEHPIDGLMQNAMNNIKQMVDVNTIIGEAVETGDGTVIIPVSKVGFGFAAGGSDFSPRPVAENEKALFGGGAGAGVSISPVGFLVVGKDQIKLIPISTSNAPLDKILDYVPTLIDKASNFIASKKKKNESEE